MKKIYLILFVALAIISCKEEVKVSGKSKADNNESRKVGYIQSVTDEGGKLFIKIDYIDWFSDEEAGKAMKEDDPKINLDDMDGIPPDGYYIRNDKVEYSKIQVDANVKISIESVADQNNESATKVISFDDFKLLFSGENKSKYTKIPFWVDLKSGVIKTIDEQYLP